MFFLLAFCLPFLMLGVATIIVNRLTGAGPTATAITSINTRANAYDTHSTADTTNPIAIPTSGTNYSYWVVTRLQCTVVPTTSVDTLKWYTDGTNSLGTGCTMKCSTATGHVQATGTAGTSGDQLTVIAYATLAGAPSNSFAYTSGAPLSVTGSTSTAQQFGDRVVYQIEIGTTASPGATATETITWKYSET